MKLLETLKGNISSPKPVWMMRQAGRYLPEYKKLRSQFPSFIDFCFTPKAVVEATLQPIKRFDFDAAIIFSDILVIPHALGQNVAFVENQGPILDSLTDWSSLLNTTLDHKLSVVYEAIKETRTKLDTSKALIGFAGCPWTIALYMLGYNKKIGFDSILPKTQTVKEFPKILEKLSESVATHCINQIKAGANVIQLFESWAIQASQEKLNDYLWNPITTIVEKIRAACPNVPIIYFPKGRVVEAMQSLKHLNIAFSIDSTDTLNQLTSHTGCLQGSLDPQKLLDGTFHEELETILEFAKNRPFIVNLGHGVLPQTPITHVEEFLKRVRE